MYPTSPRYKEQVYTMTEARHFSPEVTICVCDIFARQICSYTTNGMLAFSNRKQAYDGELQVGVNCGTLEDMQFRLDGQHSFIPKDQNAEGLVPLQLGIMSQSITDANGNFAVPFVITCQYEYAIDSFHRVLYFNQKEYSKPKNFVLQFYRGSQLVDTESVTNNDSYIYRVNRAINDYDKVIITFYATTHPYSRVKLIEDVPGDYISYKSDEVISIGTNSEADIMCEDVTSNEIDLTLLNINKQLDILNTAGMEKYLQRLQEIEVYLNMIYADDTVEKIPLGKHYLFSWETKEGTLEARYTVRDAKEKLSLGTFDGQWHDTAITFYTLAEMIFQSAGISKFIIADRLRNFTTNGLLKSCSCKEALRLVAQAMQCIVLSTVAGGIELRYVGIPTHWYTPQDFLDYSRLFQKPSIKDDKQCIKMAKIDQYTYSVNSNVTSLCKNDYNLSGTLQVEMTYVASKAHAPKISGNCTISKSQYFATKARLTLEGTGAVTIEIMGQAIDKKDSTFSVLNPEVNQSQGVYASDYEVKNELITTGALAQACADYAIFWQNRKYEYAFDWRQNPAIQLLDAIGIHDDFNKDNTTLITEQNLEYAGGVLSGSSQSIF